MFTERLNESDRAAISAHLLALSPGDRYLRFGYAARDTSVKRYVRDIDFNQDVVFGVRADDHTLDAVMLLAPEKDHAEIAVSVLAPARRRGIGSALISRTATYASHHGIDTLYMQSLRETCAIIRIARSLGIQVVTGTTDRTASKPRTSRQPLGGDITTKPITLYDAAMRDAMGGKIPNRILQRTWQQINQARA